MFRKSVLRVFFIGLLIVHGAHAGAPNTVIGCVQNGYAYCSFSGPSAIAITPNGSKAYVLNETDTVSVIDVASDMVIGCVENPHGYSCGFNSAFNGPVAVAITPDSSRAYVCSAGVFPLHAPFVSVIDVATDTVIACVTNPDHYTCGFVAGVFPHAIAITPDGKKAYVSFGGILGTAFVTVIDIASNTISNCVTNPHGYGCPINPGAEPFAIAITPNGKKAYVATTTNNLVTVIDVATDTIIGCVEPTNYPGCGYFAPISIAITPNGAKAYVCNNASDTVSVIDVATDKVINCIEPANYPGCAFSEPIAIAITPDGTTAYVVNNGSATVSIIDVATDTVIGCVEPTNYPGCQFSTPSAIAITPDGKKGYVVNPNTDSVSIIGIPPIPPTPPATILPPASVSGCKTQNIFLLQTDFINNITWSAPASGTAPVAYKIYRDPGLTQLVATVPASGPLQFYDHNRQPGIVYSYFIVSVDANGNVSTANSVTVTNCC